MRHDLTGTSNVATVQTQNKASPGIWVAFCGACGLFATLLIYRERAVALRARETLA